MKKIILIMLFALFPTAIFANSWITDTWDPLYEKANSFIGKKNWDSAMVYAEKALSVTKTNKAERSKYAAFSHKQIAEIYFRKGDYDNAINRFQLDLEITKEAEGPESRNYASALNNISVMLQMLGKYEEALPYLQESLALKEKTLGKEDSSYAYTLNNLGQISQSLGKYIQAEEYYLTALELKRKTIGEDNASYGISLMNLAILQMTLNNYDLAIPNFKKSAEILEKHLGSDNLETIKAIFQIGTSLVAIGQIEESKQYIARAEKLMQNSNLQSDPKYAEALYYSGINHWFSGNLQKAEASFLQSKSIVEKRFGNSYPLYSDCLNNLGVISRIQGNQAKSKEYLSEALQIRKVIFGAKHSMYANTLHNYAGILNDIGNFKEAKQIYVESFDIYLYLINNFISFLSESEKAAFYFAFKERFEMMNNFVLMRYEKDPDLLSVMYSLWIDTKAFLLKETQRSREEIFEKGDETIKRKFKEWRDVKSRIAGFLSYRQAIAAKEQIMIDSLIRKADGLERELSRHSADFAKDINRKTATWRDVQKSLKKGESAIEIIRVEYFDMKWTDTVYYMALIVKPETKNNPEFVLLKNGYSLEKGFLNNYQKRIKFKIDDNFSHEIYWKKIADKLVGINKVYISLDGVYNKININTLLKDDGKYVLDDLEIVVLTNTADLLLEKSKKSSKKDAALIGFPSYRIENSSSKDIKETEFTFPEPDKKRIYGLLGSYGRITELPETGVEINEIKSILEKDSWNVFTLERNYANKSKIKELDSPRILHIATHGYFLDDPQDSARKILYGADVAKATKSPLLRSGLILAGAENYLENNKMDYDVYGNGMLTAMETANLKLEGTELVVLSACETGLGVVQNGEGVYGLQRAFQSAGAHSLIMSLWKVDDLTTRELMIALYENWKDGRTLSQAFNLAQKRIKEKYEHPYYWGAFVLIGGSDN